MSIQSKFAKQFTCQNYTPTGDSKRCAHYLQKGKACELLQNLADAIDDPKCFEVHKANGNEARAKQAARRLKGILPSDTTTKTPGGKTSDQATKAPFKTAWKIPKSDVTAGELKKIGLIAKLDEDALRELEAGDWTATITTEKLGDIVVASRSEHFGKEEKRNCLTIRQAVVLAAVASAFPGAYVSGLDMKKPKEGGEGGEKIGGNGRKEQILGPIDYFCDCGAKFTAFTDQLACTNKHLATCEVCGRKQFCTEDGLTCPNGHGGAGSVIG